LSAVTEAAAFPGFHVHYAVKANTNRAILKIIAESGLGADTVSGGEIRAALQAGFPADKIMFAGVGKTDEEIRLALGSGVGCINVESREELMVIEQIASDMGVVAPVAIRVNPEIDAHTHHYITTGLAENKFGVAMSMLDTVVDHIVASQWLTLRGLHFHIGSQIETMRPFEILCERILKLQKELNARGVSMPLINVGGGLGVDYDDPMGHPIPDFKAYFDTFHRHLPLQPGQQLHFELGRAIVAQCGALVSRVLYVKQGVEKKFVILDAGMTELIRPALYQAHHSIVNITSQSPDRELYTIVGPICESADCFAEDTALPLTRRGDLVALLSAGAYGEVMSSNYHARPTVSPHRI
ncbi:MAG: diaminopimelate decarboxylase, partial [Paramuribaculum sp.]|nr:diaminopimelate decarboxylase [Paramuribaculum sp.]